MCSGQFKEVELLETQDLDRRHLAAEQKYLHSLSYDMRLTR